MLTRKLNEKNLGLGRIDEDWFAGFRNPKAVETYFNSEEVRSEGELREVDEAFYGVFDSVEQFCQELVESTEQVPDLVFPHIDWEGLWECELRHEFLKYEDDTGSVYIFHRF